MALNTTGFGANLSQIPDHYAIMFENSWQLLLQQLDVRLKDRVKLVQANGSSVRFNQMDKLSMASITAKNAQTPTSDVTLPARWAFPSAYDVANIIDEWDELFLGQVANPSSEILQSQVAAYNRTVDSTIITALLGGAYQTTAGTQNTSTVPAGTPASVTLPTAQKIAPDRVPYGGTAIYSGMTIDKIRNAKYLLDKVEAGQDDRILVISAAELQDLLSTTEVTNSLYNNVRALTDGAVDSFLNFKVIRSEQLPTVSQASILNAAGSTAATGTYRTCVAYVKQAAVLVDGGRRTYMDVRPDLSHGLCIRSTAVLGATRLFDNGVVQIATDTSKQ